MVAGSLVDHILDLEIRSVTTEPLHDQTLASLPMKSNLVGPPSWCRNDTQNMTSSNASSNFHGEVISAF